MKKIPWNKGIKYTEEMKSKQNYDGLKLGNGWNKGLKRTWSSPSEFKKGEEGYWTGKKRSEFTEETKMKMGLSRLGENNPNWKGGITSLYDTIRTSVPYKIWRKSVYEKDNYTCECGQVGGLLHADHIKPFAVIIYENNIKTLEDALNCYELWDKDNGRTLCKECHQKTPSYLSGTKRILEELINKN